MASSGPVRPTRQTTSARPIRTCVGCRERADRADLVRLVVVDGPGAVPRVEVDPHGSRPGRGAWLHPETGCLDLAVRRKALARAFRLSGPLNLAAVQAWWVDRIDRSPHQR